MARLAVDVADLERPRTPRHDRGRGRGRDLASVVGAPSALVGLAGFLGFVAAAILLTRWVRRDSSWLSRRVRHGQIEQGRPGGFWDRASRAVMARPVISLVLSASFLIVLSLPFWLQSHPEDDGRGIKQGLSGITTLPDDIQTKQAFLALVDASPSRARSRPRVLILGNPTDPEVQQGSRRSTPRSPTTRAWDAGGTSRERGRKRHARRDPARGRRPTPRARRRCSRSAICAGPTSPRRSRTGRPGARRWRDGVHHRLLRRLERLHATDHRDRAQSVIHPRSRSCSDSLVVPAKAIVMNLLSVQAAAQADRPGVPEGRSGDRQTIADAFGFQQTDAIEAWLPLFLFSILFGLSMDYHVFLLTRIERSTTRPGQRRGGHVRPADDRWDHHGRRDHHGHGLQGVRGRQADGARGDGVRARDRGLDRRHDRPVDPRPVGDEALGDRNWYLPRWLQWLPDLDVEGHEAETSPFGSPSPARGSSQGRLNDSSSAAEGVLVQAPSSLQRSERRGGSSRTRAPRGARSAP